MNRVIIWGNSLLGRRSSKFKVGELKWLWCIWGRGRWPAGWVRVREEESGWSFSQIGNRTCDLYLNEIKSFWRKFWAEECLTLTYVFRGLFWLLCWEGSGPGKQWEQIGNYYNNLARDDNGLSWWTGDGIQEEDRYQEWLHGLGLEQEKWRLFSERGKTTLGWKVKV